MTTEQNKKDLYKGYVKEALANLREQDLVKTRMAEIKEAVKESGFDTKEFNAVVKVAYDSEKAAEQLEALQIAIDSVEDLKL